MGDYRTKLEARGHGVAKCGAGDCVHDAKNLWRHPGKGPIWLCDSCYDVVKETGL